MKQQKMLDRYMDRVEKLKAPRAIGIAYPGEHDAQTMTENVRIAAETFEELQAILAKFHAVAKQLPAVPDSVIAPSKLTPMGPMFG
jgi:hypothetical protein